MLGVGATRCYEFLSSSSFSDHVPMMKHSFHACLRRLSLFIFIEMGLRRRGEINHVGLFAGMLSDESRSVVLLPTIFIIITHK